MGDDELNTEAFQQIKSSSPLELLLLLFRRRRRFRVVERSMLPTFKEGDEVLVDERAYLQRLPEVGEVVVAMHPIRPRFYLIKRVKQVRDDGTCFLVGDNQSESTDSRQLGWFTRNQLIGHITSYL